MSKLKAIVGDKTDDKTLAFIEDVDETFNSKNKGDNEDWKKKYEDNDKMWREKYRDRFFNKANDEPEDEEEAEQEKQIEKDTKEAEKLRFENLFKEE